MAEELEELELEPEKALFQLCAVSLATDEVIWDSKVVAYSQDEAIIKAKIGTIIQRLGFEDDEVQILLRIIGYINPRSAILLANKPALTTAEAEFEEKKARDLYTEVNEVKTNVANLEAKQSGR